MVMATPPTPNDATRSNINFRFNGFLQHWRCWYVNNRAAVEVEQLVFFDNIVGPSSLVSVHVLVGHLTTEREANYPRGQILHSFT